MSYNLFKKNFKININVSNSFVYLYDYFINLLWLQYGDNNYAVSSKLSHHNNVLDWYVTKI